VRGLSTPDIPHEGPPTSGHPADGHTADPAPRDDAGVGSALVAFTAAAEGDRPAGRRHILRLADALGRSARNAGTGAVLRGRWLADVMADVAPRIPVRDLATLRAHHHGLDGEDLADALVSTASRATAAVGAAGGALVAVEWTAPPSLLVTLPVQLAVETLAVAAIEVKLLAELHAVYDAVPAGSSTQHGRAYLMAWANRRGLDPSAPMGGTLALGAAAKQQLRRRLAGRLGRNFTTVGPLLTGAVAGSVINARETRKLGARVREDLRPGRRPRVRRW
jgi:hypothetical protein